MESLIDDHNSREFVQDPALLEDLLPQNFVGVNTICAYLRAREPGRQEAAHG